MEGFVKLRNLQLDALASIVGKYPWFGVAQKILCDKMSETGGAQWGEAQYAEAAMYVPLRGRIFSLLRVKSEFSDKDASELLKKYMDTSSEPSEPAEMTGTNKAFRGVGDYFSVEQYDEVRHDGTPWPHHFGVSETQAEPPVVIDLDFEDDFCTETLAEIYADQGYKGRAKDIYSKLILVYPEKSAYFASLIEKLNLEK